MFEYRNVKPIDNFVKYYLDDKKGVHMIGENQNNSQKVTSQQTFCNSVETYRS